MAKFAVILPAAGQSSRFKDKEKKPYINIDGRAIWLRTAEHFINRPDVCQCMLVISPQDDEMVRRRYGANLAFLNVQIVHGGAERFESVANALAALSPEVDHVAIHDAVRPCVTEGLINAVFAKAEQTGAALLAVAVTDTIKQADASHKVQGTVPRAGLWLAQTPQAFRRQWLEEAYAKRQQIKEKITDDSQLVEAIGHPVHVVEGAPTNIKITTKQDLQLAESLVKVLVKPKPTGPLHPFAEEEMWGGRPK